MTFLLEEALGWTRVIYCDRNLIVCTKMCFPRLLMVLFTKQSMTWNSASALLKPFDCCLCNLS